MGAELSFCELRTKMVINVIDGNALGRIVDIIFSRESSRVIGVVVPGDKCFRIFNKKGDIFIPYDKIVRIGLDVILAELRPFGISSDAHSPSILLN
jgi:YlmC/YmxH family sporulation protein